MPALLLAFALTILAAGAASAQVTDPRRGLAYATHDCGVCHAVGLNDASRNALAPPFRTLRARHPGLPTIDIVLRAWSVPHREMPDFFGDTARAREILAHIESVQRP